MNKPPPDDLDREIANAKQREAYRRNPLRFKLKNARYLATHPGALEKVRQQHKAWDAKRRQSYRDLAAEVIRLYHEVQTWKDVWARIQKGTDQHADV